MKQSSMADYVRSPLNQLQGYNVKSSGWLAKSDMSTSPVSTKVKKESRAKPKTRKGTRKLPPKSPSSPLEKWVQRDRQDQSKKYDALPLQIDTGKPSKKNTKKSFTRSHSFEKYGIVFPNPDDILKSIDTIEKEGKMLDDYDDLVDGNVSTSDSLKFLLEPGDESGPLLPLLDCEHLSCLELKKYFHKYSGYLKDILDEVEFSQRHQTYKNENSRSRLTYSFSTLVFTQSQLEYLMKKIEKSLDPQCEKTEYSFKVWLPELCLRIFMDLYNMNKEEAVDYLNQRPVD